MTARSPWEEVLRQMRGIEALGLADRRLPPMRENELVDVAIDMFNRAVKCFYEHNEDRMHRCVKRLASMPLNESGSSVGTVAAGVGAFSTLADWAEETLLDELEWLSTVEAILPRLSTDQATILRRCLWAVPQSTPFSRKGQARIEAIVGPDPQMRMDVTEADPGDPESYVYAALELVVLLNSYAADEE